MAQLLGVALLSATVLGSLEPAAAARLAPNRPLELGAPLHFRDGVLSVGGALPAVTNPRHNVAPSPDFVTVCAQDWHSSECRREALAAIKHARALEGVTHPAMILPRNYSKLTVAEQTFVITDLERVGRGLKPFAGLTRSLNTASHTAAVARVDPMPVLSLLQALGVHEYGSIWAGDFGPLGSDYDWMYNDGYSPDGSINLDCATPQGSGCWGHRENILGKYGGLPTLLAGAGTGTPAGESIAEVMTGGHGSAPAFTYSWREAKRHGANRRRR